MDCAPLIAISFTIDINPGKESSNFVLSLNSILLRCFMRATFLEQGMSSLMSILLL